MPARLLKILGWTAGMGCAAFLVVDGKMVTDNWPYHFFWGAVLGLVLGYLFSRNLKKGSN